MTSQYLFRLNSLMILNLITTARLFRNKAVKFYENVLDKITLLSEFINLELDSFILLWNWRIPVYLEFWTIGDHQNDFFSKNILRKLVNKNS